MPILTNRWKNKSIWLCGNSIEDNKTVRCLKQISHRELDAHYWWVLWTFWKKQQQQQKNTTKPPNLLHCTNMNSNINWHSCFLKIAWGLPLLTNLCRTGPPLSGYVCVFCYFVCLFFCAEKNSERLLLHFKPKIWSTNKQKMSQNPVSLL